MVATQESINSRSCSVVEIKLSVFLKGGQLTRSGSSRIQIAKIVFDICTFEKCFVRFRWA